MKVESLNQITPVGLMFSKRKIKRAAKYSLALALVVPAISGLFFLLSFAPAPVAMGAIFGLFSFPIFLYVGRQRDQGYY